MMLPRFGMVSISNIVSLLTSISLLSVLPKSIGVEEFAYWQLYLYWLTFSPLLHVGWADGVYVIFGRFAKITSDPIWDRHNFVRYVAFISILTLFVCWILVMVGPEDPVVWVLISMSIFITNIRAYFYSLMQSQGRLFDFSSNVILYNFSLLVMVMAVIIFLEGQYVYLIVSDLAARLLTTFTAGYIVSKGFVNKESSGDKIATSFRLGLPLMLAYIGSILNSGLVRGVFTIKWGVIAFGGLSLMMAVSKIFLLTFQPLTLTMFPALKRLEDKDVDSFIFHADYVLSCVLLFFVFLYFLFGLLISVWLPEYSSFVVYYNLLGVFCFFETRFLSIYVPASKAKEEVAVLFVGNLISAMIIAMSCFIFAYIYESPEALVVSVGVSSAFKVLMIKRKVFGFPVKEIFLSFWFLFICAALMIFGRVMEMTIFYVSVLLLLLGLRYKSFHTAYVFLRLSR